MKDKNKFDLVYESIMDILDKAKVDYQLVSDFKTEAQEKIDNCEDVDSVADFVNNMIKKGLKWNDPSKNDKINVLKEIVIEKFGEDKSSNKALDIIEQYEEKQKKDQ